MIKKALCIFLATILLLASIPMLSIAEENEFSSYIIDLGFATGKTEEIANKMVGYFDVSAEGATENQELTPLGIDGWSKYDRLFLNNPQDSQYGFLMKQEILDYKKSIKGIFVSNVYQETMTVDGIIYEPVGGIRGNADGTNFVSDAMFLKKEKVANGGYEPHYLYITRDSNANETKGGIVDIVVDNNKTLDGYLTVNYLETGNPYDFSDGYRAAYYLHYKLRVQDKDLRLETMNLQIIIDIQFFSNSGYNNYELYEINDKVEKTAIWKKDMKHYGYGNWRTLTSYELKLKDGSQICGNLNLGGNDNSLYLVNQYSTPGEHLGSLVYGVNEAITGIVTDHVLKNKLEYNGCTYYPIGCLWEEFYEETVKDPTYSYIKGFNANFTKHDPSEHLDTKQNVYLYITMDPAAGNPITEIYYRENSERNKIEGLEQLKDVYGNNESFCSDRNFITGLFIKRCDYSKEQLMAIWTYSKTNTLNENLKLSQLTVKRAIEEYSSSNYVINVKNTIYGFDKDKKTSPIPDDEMYKALERQYPTGYKEKSFKYGYDSWYPLRNDGEAADFNDDTWDEFIGLIFQYVNGARDFNTSNYKQLEMNTIGVYEAITGFVCSSECKDTLVVDGIVYEIVEGINFYSINLYDPDEKDKRTKEPVPIFHVWNSLNLNYGAGGDSIYLYVTRDDKAGAPITDLWFEYGYSPDSSYIPVCDINGVKQDFNAGTGDDAIYFYYKRGNYTKSQIASAIKIRNEENEKGHNLASVFSTANTTMLIVGTVIIVGVTACIIVYKKKKH